ncbi:MAG: ATP phosphoribosyltransferase, partial [Alphaproteobacteria bacterium]
MAELLFGIPSKGRMHEEAKAWLAAASLPLERDGAARGYLAKLKGAQGIEVHLLSAGEIASMLDSGKLQIGLTGFDLLNERAAGMGDKLRVIAKLGFSRARVVVAVPEAWIDVDTMSDLRDAAARFHDRTRARFRVATKFRHLTRRFFASHGLTDYRIVPSLGATEGAPGAGAAELIVDITETGSTLAANQLR